MPASFEVVGRYKGENLVCKDILRRKKRAAQQSCTLFAYYIRHGHCQAAASP